MASKQAEVITTKIARRASLSASLLERMGISAAAFERVALNALVMQPQVAECDPTSVDRALIQCINAGLIPDGREAVIVPFRNKREGKVVATMIPMVEGQIKLARQASPGLALRVIAVYKDDEWEYEEGLTPVLRHVPNPDGSRKDADLIAAYAIAKLPDASEPEYEVMWRSDIDRIRAMSRARGGPWEDHFIAMSKKTVCKQLLKRLPKSVSAPSDPPPELERYELDPTADPVVADIYTEPPPALPDPEEKPKPRRRTTRRKPAEAPPPPPEDPPADDDYDEEIPSRETP